MKIQASLTYEKVRHDQDTDAHVVVTLEAPKTDWQKNRPPVCVIPVIDNSGSMVQPPAKLDRAKNSVMKLFDQLQPGDYAGLAAFSTDVNPIAPPREMTQSQKDGLKAKAGGLKGLSSTNFAGGLLCGLKWANAADLPPSVLARVIMFTDGHANVGIQDREGLMRLGKGNLGRASVSCFGYGDDADQELLADLSKELGGNYAHIKNPDDALSAFAKELGGLLSTYAQNVELCFEAQNGHELVEVVSDVTSEERDGKVYVKIPDVLSEEVRHLVLSLKLKQQPQALPREMTVVNLSASWDVLSADGKMERVEKSLKAKVRFVKPGEEQKEPDKVLGEIVGRDLLVKAQVEAEAMANTGNYAGAEQVMGMYSMEMERAGHVNLASAGQKMRRRMGSASLFAGSAGYRSVMKKGMTRAVAVSAMDGDALCDMEELGIQVTTSSQQEMMDHMAGAPAAPPVVVVPPPATPAPSRKPGGGLSKSRSNRW